VLVGSVVALLACDRGPVAPGNTGQLEVVAVSQAGVALDAGKVIVVGPSSNPTTTKRDAAPGQTVKIDGLAPGTYTVALQGFVAGDVAMFGLTSGVQVTAGQNATATVSFNSFVPAADQLPSSATGKTFSVRFPSIAGAARYQVEAATDQAFTVNKVSAEVTAGTAPQTSVDITVADYGTFYARVRAVDPYQTMGEWATVPGSVTLKPDLSDLIVESLTHTPASPTTADMITFTAVVKNVGSAGAGASTLELRIGGETPGAPQTQLAVPALGPGQSFTAQRQLQLSAGNYRNTATADVTNVVAESDETNNVKTDDYTVTAAPRADLVISAPATLTVSPTSVVAGGTVSLPAWTVMNQGTAASNAFRNGFYLSTDATITAADRLITTNSNTALAAGASFNWGGPTLTIPADVVPGSYFIGILVDDLNGTAESNEGNNFKSTALTVTAAAPTTIVSCGPYTGGDLITRGFYVPNYPGASLAAADLFLSSTTAGSYTFSLTARSGAYNGPVIGSGQATVTLSSTSSSFALTTFDFPSPAVTRGSTVAFLLTMVSGPSTTAFFSVVATFAGDPACQVTETEDTSPPLSTVRRNGVYINIRGRP
jgi:CARDB protein